jgi:hypothetical protein
MLEHRYLLFDRNLFNLMSYMERPDMVFSKECAVAKHFKFWRWNPRLSVWRTILVTDAFLDISKDQLISDSWSRYSRGFHFRRLWTFPLQTSLSVVGWYWKIQVTSPVISFKRSRSSWNTEPISQLNVFPEVCDPTQRLLTSMSTEWSTKWYSIWFSINYSTMQCTMFCNMVTLTADHGE